MFQSPISRVSLLHHIMFTAELKVQTAYVFQSPISRVSLLHEISDNAHKAELADMFQSPISRVSLLHQITEENAERIRAKMFQSPISRVSLLHSDWRNRIFANNKRRFNPLLVGSHFYTLPFHPSPLK